MPRGFVFVLIALAASCLSLLLLVESVRATEQTRYTFMAWNLELAWVPFALALVLVGVTGRRGGAVVIVPVLLAWVLFLPNAPYLATDLWHLRGPGAPAVSDVAMFLGFAVTGVYVGLVSAWFVRVALCRVWTPRTVGRIVNASLLLCGVGIFLGRAVQVNSWDLITRPGLVVGGAAAHFDGIGSWVRGVLIIGISAGLLVGGDSLLTRIADPRRQRSPA